MDPMLCSDHFQWLDISAHSQLNILYAEMSEWSIVQSWNGCVQQCTQGSNPCLCANRENTNLKFVFFNYNYWGLLTKLK